MFKPTREVLPGAGRSLVGDCRNYFFVFVSDRSRSGLAENLGQIRFS